MKSKALNIISKFTKRGSSRSTGSAATDAMRTRPQNPRCRTMASLAAGLHIPDAEAQLRLLNGLYPRGEPRTGDWIKVIR